MVETLGDATRITEVMVDSPGWRAGLRAGDRVLSVNGITPRDIIEWHRLTSDSSVLIEIEREDQRMEFGLEAFGEAPGLRVESALFDRVQTCDNHCEFCFIYQLPKGMRRSLYLKDDDYRLSFLFGNFTTLTRFTEADLERVADERLSPLYVSIHAVEPPVRAEMLRNPRGGVSLRWLGMLLRHGISVRAQIVLCPGVNDEAILESTLCGLLEQYPDLDSIAIVPLGLSKFNSEQRMRVHTVEEARRVIDAAERWQSHYRNVLGRQPVFLSDEFYLVAGRALPERDHYGDFSMLEDGIGIARAFIDDFSSPTGSSGATRSGFFAAFDAPNPTPYVGAANPASATALRANSTPVKLRGRRTHRNLRPTVLTGAYGARILEPLIREHRFTDVEVRTVENLYFGGNTAVAGLMTSEDVRRTIESGDRDRLFLLPDVCLNDGRFLDGPTVRDLDGIASIEVVETSGAALRARLEQLREKRDDARQH